MAEHFKQSCKKHGEKRREVYDDHFIWICDKCARDRERIDYKRERRFMKLRELVRRLDLRIQAGRLSLDEVDAILANAARSGSTKYIVDMIRAKN